MVRAFEWFRDPEGRLTTNTGIPYNELFSTREIRRLTFTRLQANQNQDFAPKSSERRISGDIWPAVSLLP